MYQPGDIIKAKVFRVWKNYVILTTKNGERCYLNINEASDYYVNSLNMMFKIGDIKEVIILETILSGGYNVSFKRIHPKELRNPFDFKMDDSNTNFEQLLEFTNKGLRYGK
ncbi:30S ribosomal protein s1 [Metamycoplasma cloacale]|uniref:Uncharacterized protein n=1 Tax=Metamycoplasma cloacale TaxID=92401 RepID=A0A2Z4LMK2_9BACT|nr:hypothetical protein [Metamycoplasma cloacale]AWX42950.1 hypothetical protein DK849_02675 [Metamycoplasma cloacale]VEU79226.1 30S ribosomal protein s1 [Metamycoplasma cloacale]